MTIDRLNEHYMNGFEPLGEGDLDSPRITARALIGRRDSLESQLPSHFVRTSGVDFPASTEGVNVPPHSNYPNPMDQTVQDYNFGNK
ncbi:MAG: hypothetical protein AABW63_01340 [Nanoarchaeota archaeon]